MVINSTISTPKANYMVGDVNNFYTAGEDMDRYEYMRLPIALILEEIVQQYNLLPKVHHRFVYIQIRKGMYGLPQAGIIANQLLTKRLAPHGYYQCCHTPGLWRHQWGPILFSLGVDDFGVKYVGKHHANHLVAAIEEHYTFSKDWTGAFYCGIQLEWDYDKQTVNLSMPDYIKNALHKCQHIAPAKPQHAPHTWRTVPNYGAKQQTISPADESPLLFTEGQHRIQQVVGTLLYYARAVDAILLVALSTIASQQAKATKNTNKMVQHLLDYCHTHPDATIRYRASNMILQVHSNTSYLAEDKAGPQQVPTAQSETSATS